MIDKQFKIGCVLFFIINYNEVTMVFRRLRLNLTYFSRYKSKSVDKNLLFFQQSPLFSPSIKLYVFVQASIKTKTQKVRSDLTSKCTVIRIYLLRLRSARPRCKTADYSNRTWRARRVAGFCRGCCMSGVKCMIRRDKRYFYILAMWRL